LKTFDRSEKRSGKKDILLILDANEYIFGLSELKDTSVKLLDVLPFVEGLKVIVPSTVLDEATRNLSYIHSILVTKLNDLIYGYEKFSVVSDAGLPQSLVEEYQRLGLPSEADARIGAFTEWVKAHFLVSENQHFLKDLKTTAYKVIDAAEVLQRIEANSLRDAGQNVVTTHTG
jgi:hypothetical protein